MGCEFCASLRRCFLDQVERSLRRGLVGVHQCFEESPGVVAPQDHVSGVGPHVAADAPPLEPAVFYQLGGGVEKMPPAGLARRQLDERAELPGKCGYVIRSPRIGVENNQAARCGDEGDGTIVVPHVFVGGGLFLPADPRRAFLGGAKHDLATVRHEVSVRFCLVSRQRCDLKERMRAFRSRCLRLHGVPPKRMYPSICITKRIARFAKIELPVPGLRDGELTAKIACDQDVARPT